MKKLHLLSLKAGDYSCEILANYGAALNSYRFKEHEFVDGYSCPEEILEQQYKGVILAPFPNRVAEGRYRFNETIYQLPINRAKEGLALHGFVYNKVFTVLESRQNRALLAYSYKGELESFPFLFDLKIAYALSEEGILIVDTSIINLASSPMPFGLGWHPYFKLGSNVDEQVLQMPECSLLELDEKLIPTGVERKFSVDKQEHSLLDKHFDSCFAMKDKGEASFVLKDCNWELKLTSPSSCDFPYFQVYTPKHRQSVAIEPMTCAPNAFNNQQGLIILEPLKTMNFQFSLQVIGRS